MKAIFSSVNKIEVPAAEVKTLKMRAALILLQILCFSFILFSKSAGKAACHNPVYGSCYGINHNCPTSCPRFCEVDCRLCKPYCGAQRVSKWKESVDSLLIHLNGEAIVVPTGESKAWESLEKGLMLRRLAETNKVEVKVDQLFEIVARVVPITPKESSVHGYDLAEEDCFAHLELNFKFESLTKLPKQ